MLPIQERWKNNMKIVIVGGVAGGATAAARIRRLDEQAEEMEILLNLLQQALLHGVIYIM